MVIKRQTGSRILPYILHPHDNDIVYIYLNQVDYITTHRRELIEQLRNDHVDGQFQLAMDLPNRVSMWTYLYHFIEPIEGVQYPDIYQLHDEILIRLNHLVDKFKFRAKEIKIFYHIYTNLAMWRNGNYELTSDDIARINRFHDRCATDEDFDIMFKMLEEENGKK